MPTPTPKIALVHDFLQTFGGAERVLLELAILYPQAPIYTLTFSSKLAHRFDPARIRTSYLQKISWLPAHLLLPLYPKAIESFDFSEFDVVISSSHSFAKNIITKPTTHHISYIHSPMRYAWDAWHEYLADKKLNPLVGWVVRGILHKIRIWDYFGAGRVDTYIANSRHVAKRIFKYYRKPSQVIYPPVDVAGIAMGSEREDFFLVISRLSRYKQIDTAILACNKLNLPLVIIGEGEDKQRLQQLAGPTVTFTGWLDDATKYNYLAKCRALLFCNEEDFGIVPVEAMAAGKPVIAYGKGGLLESVVAGVTGLFYPQPTSASLAATIQEFIGKENTFNPAAIRTHAEQFGADVFAHKIQAMVDSVVENNIA